MGKQGLVTSAQGYGCMGLSAFYGAAVENEQANGVLRKAFDLGVRHFDTAEVYAGKNAAGEPVHNEQVVGAWLKTLSPEERKEVSFATKYMPYTDDKKPCTLDIVRKTLEASLARLGEPSVDLYYLHRCPGIEAVKSFAEACKVLIAEGKIKYYGLSEATPEEIRAAHSIQPLTAVQQEWSIVVRNLEKDIRPVCEELGIAIVAYSPLARGLASGLVKTDEDWSKIGNEGGAKGGFQSMCPYLQGDSLKSNVARLAGLESVAGKRGLPASQVSLAWLHRHGGDMVFPIPGTTKVANVETNAGAVALAADLSQEEMNAIGAQGELVGDRYPAQMQGMCFEQKNY